MAVLSQVYWWSVFKNAAYDSLKYVPFSGGLFVVDIVQFCFETSHIHKSCWISDRYFP